MAEINEHPKYGHSQGGSGYEKMEPPAVSINEKGEVTSITLTNKGTGRNLTKLNSAMMKRTTPGETIRRYQETGRYMVTPEPTPLYRIIRVPPDLHQSWIDIAYQMSSDRTPRQVVQGAVLGMLQKWFRSLYPASKLCNFEEFTPEEARKVDLPVEPGFYLRIRKMTPQELKASLEYEKRERENKPSVPGTQTGINPRWELEGRMYYIGELREADPGKYLS